MLLSCDSCVTQLWFLCYSVGIPVLLSWYSSVTQLGFLCYSRVTFCGTHFVVSRHFLRHVKWFFYRVLYVTCRCVNGNRIHKQQKMIWIPRFSILSNERGRSTFLIGPWRLYCECIYSIWLFHDCEAWLLRTVCTINVSWNQWKRRKLFTKLNLAIFEG